MLQYSQMPSRGWSRTIRSFRFAMGLAFPHSSLAGILARLSRLVCFEQMIRECHTHGRLHVRLEWIPTDRAVFQLASVDQMRIWFRPMYFMRFLCHADSLRRSCRHSMPCGNQTAPLPKLYTILGDHHKTYDIQGKGKYGLTITLAGVGIGTALPKELFSDAELRRALSRLGY